MKKKIRLKFRAVVKESRRSTMEFPGPWRASFLSASADINSAVCSHGNHFDFMAVIAGKVTSDDRLFRGVFVSLKGIGVKQKPEPVEKKPEEKK